MDTMIRTTLFAAALLISSVACSAQSGTVDAYCTLHWGYTPKGMIHGPCKFTQKQGNVDVTLGHYKFNFLAADSGEWFERDDTAERIRFTRGSEYALQIFQGGESVVKNRLPIKNNREWKLSCTLNGLASTCQSTPAGKGGFTLMFSHGVMPVYVFTPVEAGNTNRKMWIDGSGQKWAMSGDRIVQLKEISGNGNKITVVKPK